MDKALKKKAKMLKRKLQGEAKQPDVEEGQSRAAKKKRKAKKKKAPEEDDDAADVAAAPAAEEEAAEEAEAAPARPSNATSMFSETRFDSLPLTDGTQAALNSKL